MAGYSGTPLVKKVGVKPGHTVVVLHAPAGWTLPDLPPDVSFVNGVSRELVLPTGLVDVEVAALDNDWSGLKFLWRKERRQG